jgi:nitrogenase molybdenum-iron protein alpha/beta subunit
VFEDAEVDRVFSEIEQQEERMVRACDKYLLRFDPPSVIIFAGFSYAVHVAATLERYLDADIRCIGSRNTPGESKYPAEQVTGLEGVRSLIGQHNPDLVMGSSFERSVCEARAFTGITPPLRGTIRLAPTPFAGINGTLCLMEQMLNACMDKKPKKS